MAVEELTVRAKLRDELSRPLGNVKREVKGLARETEKLGGKARQGNRELLSMGTGVGKLSRLIGGGLVKAAKIGATALVGLGVAGVAGLTKVIGMATDAGEAASAFGTVFAAQREEMDGWVKDMHTAYGITSQDLHGAATTFGVFGKAAGVADDELGDFTTSLVEASLDLGSFYNAAPEEVFQAMQSGLSGSAEPLRKFGIFMSDASLNAFAAAEGIGKTTQEMTEGEKVALRQAFILSEMGDAQGDLARTSDSLANLQRALKGRITEAGTAIGTAFLPYAETMAQRANELATDLMPKLEAKLEALPGLLALGGEAFRNMADAWAEGASYGDTVATGLETLGINAEGVAPFINTVADVLGDLWTILTDLVLPVIAEVSAILPGFTSPMQIAADVIGFVADNAETLVPIVSALTAGYLAWNAATLAYNAITIASNALTFIRTAATSGLAAAQLGATTATGGLAAGTAVLNTIMSLNPIVLVVAALAALAAGLIIAYKRSETFRAMVDKVWEVVKGAGRAVRSTLGGALEWVAEKFRWVSEKAQGLIDKLKNLPGAGLVGRLFGDTATSKAGSGNLATTLATHAAISGGGVGGPTITNALIGGHANSDHLAGRALDLKGSNLISYAQTVRAMGGYAAFHGSGPDRHLHAAYGDTPRPRARARAVAPAAAGGGGTTLMLNGPLVNVEHAGSDVDVERAARRALEAFVRDRAERS